MSFPSFDIVQIPVRPLGKILCSQQIDDALAINAQLRRAAAVRLLRARAAMTQRRARAEAALNKRLAILEIECKARADRAELQAVAQAVQWLVDENELERRIAARITRSVADCAADAFVEFAANEDRAALLALRVHEAIARWSSECLPTIGLSPGDHAEVARQIGAGACRFIADPQLQPGTATLDSPYVRIVIDLSRHAALLTDYLRSPIPLQISPPRPDGIS